MTEKRTILLIGKTGNGKSTLANALSGTNIFEESSGSNSFTKQFKSWNFEDKKRGIEYTIIDTPGIGDTDKENEKEVYRQIVKAVYHAQKKLNQVLFITKGRFTIEEEKTHELLWDGFFDESVINFTTIVKTNFPKFSNQKVCERDIEETSGKIAEIIKSCDKRVVHLDNPPLEEIDDEDELELNQKKRNKSREKLLEHLTNSSSQVYHHQLSSTTDEKIKRINKMRWQLGDIMKEIEKHDKDINNRMLGAEKGEERGNKTKVTGERILEVGIAAKAGTILGIMAAPEAVLVGAIAGRALGKATDELVSGSFHAVGDATIWIARRAKTQALKTKDFLVEKYEIILNSIVEEWAEMFSILKASENCSEKKDLEKLRKMYDDRVIELGKKTEDLNKKLEIIQLFKEEEEKLQLQFFQEYPVKN